jgi:hypothetical protein
MIRDRVADFLSVKYEKRLLIFDTSGFSNTFDYLGLLKSEGFCVVPYADVESFRLRYEVEIKNSPEKWAVIITDDIYVPYDIRIGFYEVILSLGAIFPKLDETVIARHKGDLDIISYSYDAVYFDKLYETQTEYFIEDEVFSNTNVKEFCDLVSANILPANIEKATSYSEWINIARVKSTIEVYAAKAGLPIDLSFIDDAFSHFVLNDYSKLSGQTSSAAPTILPKVFDYIARDKAALIVMDGMSLFDFNILSRYFDGIEYELQCSYALIPSTTAISRQCLLSGKYPRQLENPFSLSKEEKGFYDAAAEHGYSKQQAAYIRGYDVQPSPFTKLLAVIINDIDDIVHGQQQGRLGMFNDITLLAKTGRLQALIHSLHKAGFKVYLTADHGNTLCRGIGALRNAGVELETKAKRMLILKDFADISNEVIENTVEYPAYYLDKSFRYLICKTGVSFDNKNIQVMTHGGITIDEVIVPFVKIKAVE